MLNTMLLMDKKELYKTVNVKDINENCFWQIQEGSLNA